jgi:phosphopantetheinyl transferase
MKIKPDFPIKLLLIKLSDDFDYISYSKVFSLLNWGKINSYLQKKDQLRAFVSELLQKYWLASIFAINPEELEISFTKDMKPYLVSQKTFPKRSVLMFRIVGNM